MLKPNPNFRPDPTRAVFVDGPLDEKLLSRLTPQILRLQALSRRPISVYILDSPGGSTTIMQGILRLLRLSDQNSSAACHIITVATTRAASASADLLSSGDYAVAIPGCQLLYHGVRMPGLMPALQPLTAERASIFAHILRLTNDAFAMELVRKTERRFFFRFTFSRPEFNAVRAKNQNKQLSDLDCFIEVVSAKLSPKAKEIFKRAQERYARYEPLFTRLSTEQKSARRKRPIRDEADRIKAIVDFEAKENKSDPEWTFKTVGLTRVAEDFFLIAEHLENQQSDRLKYWCAATGRFALTKEELTQIDQIPEADARNEAIVAKVQPSLQPVWSFFVALCHSLQEQDNELTAEDAYWLGLVDEVMGRTDLLTERWFNEWEEEPPPPPSEINSQKQIETGEKPTLPTADTKS